MTKDVGVCSPDDDLETASDIMLRHQASCLLVIDASARAVGVLTAKDICLRTYMEGRPLRDLPVSAAMSQLLWTCRPDDSMDEAEEIFQAHDLRYLPVVDSEGHLKGLLSIHDISGRAHWPKQEAAGSEGA